MLQAIIDFLLYIPRRINNHFETFENLKLENQKLKQDLRNRKNLLKRISYKCDDYMKKNKAVSYSGFKNIKELANMFPNDTTNSL